jgi:hypothetical protein
MTADIPCRSRYKNSRQAWRAKAETDVLCGHPASKTDSRHGIVAAVSDP